MIIDSGIMQTIEMLQIEKTDLKGVYLIKPSAHEDKRGNFYETYNEKEYHDAGLTAKFIQDDISKSVKGVLKGMHGDPGTYKLVQCAYGSVYAVILNCDETSPDFGKNDLIRPLSFRPAYVSWYKC